MQILNILFLLIAVNTNAQSIEEVRFLTQLNSILNPKSSGCGDLYSKDSYSCPKFLKELVEDDPKRALMRTLQSAEKSCGAILKDKSASQISSQDLMAGFHTVRMSSTPMKELGNLAFCLSNKNEQLTKKMISKYFVHSKRLQEGVRVNLEEISILNSLLGKTPNAETEKYCKNLSNEYLQKQCINTLFNCSQSFSMDALLQATELYLAEKNKIELEIKELENKKRKLVRNYGLNEIVALIKIKKYQLKAISYQIPWVNQDLFVKKIESGDSALEAMKAQLELNRKELLEENNKFNENLKCLNGEGNCDLMEYRKRMSNTANLADEFFIFKNFKKGVLSGVYSYERYQECVTDLKIEQDIAYEKIFGATKLAGYSLASLMLGSYVGGASAALSLGKSLAQIASVTMQADQFVTQIEHTIRSCSGESFGLNSTKKVIQYDANSPFMCPDIKKQMSMAAQYEGCMRDGIMSLVSVASLGLTKYAINLQAKFDPTTWVPKDERELKIYFSQHIRDVNTNAKKLLASNGEIFKDLNSEILKILKTHDIEKLLSFQTLAQKYGYKGVPIEIVEGLSNKAELLSKVSADGKFVEVNMAKVLQLMWGTSPENLAGKINMATTAAEKLHYESLLKLNRFAVAQMEVIDAQLMGTALQAVSSADARVQLKLLEVLSDEAARVGNTVTKSEMGKTILSTPDYIEKKGMTWFIGKLADPNSPGEVEAAERLLKRVTAGDIKTMSEQLGKGMSTPAMPTDVRNIFWYYADNLKQK